MLPARMRGARRALIVALLVSGTLSHAASLLRSPYLQNVGTDRATIIWTSPVQLGAGVRYSESGDLTKSVPASVRQLPGSTLFQYRVELRNLKPSREYFYEVVAGGQAITEHLRFRTAGPGPFRFLVFGDSGTGSESQLALARRMAETENPSLVLHTGDMSQESGTPEQLDTTYLQTYSQLMGRAPFFPTPGNHDYYTDGANPCFAIHAAPASGVPAEDLGRYYSFDWGNVHFVSVNSNLLEFDDAATRMLAWLEKDLTNQKNFWKVVYLHHPPYPTGHHKSDPVSALVRERVVPVLERHGVHVVFTGHEHSYQRTYPLRGGSVADANGTVYVTTGGGGGVLHQINPSNLHAVGKSEHHYLRVDVRGARMSLTAVGLDGRVIDTTTVTASSNPRIEAVVNAGSFTQSLAPGTIFSIFGRSLAVEERSPSAATLELAGTSVTMNGQRLPLLYVAPHQINAQLPFGLSGPGLLQVHTRTAVDDAVVEVEPSAPGILWIQVGFRQYPSIWRAAGNALVTPNAPVKPGEHVSLFLVGLGAVDGNLSAGEPAPGDPPLRVVAPVLVRIGERDVAPSFAGLTPGFAGLYQINVEVPPDLPAGPAALRVVTGNVASEPVTLFLGSSSPQQ